VGGERRGGTRVGPLWGRKPPAVVARVEHLETNRGPKFRAERFQSVEGVDTLQYMNRGGRLKRRSEKGGVEVRGVTCARVVESACRGMGCRRREG